jgi:hypothetical protein
MDDLEESMRKTNTHCGESAYVELINNIKLCKFYVDPINSAKKVRVVMQRYFSEINLDPLDYYGVSKANFNHVVEVSKLQEHYQKICQKYPYDYVMHIAAALRFFELLREGAELGYGLRPINSEAYGLRPIKE